MDSTLLLEITVVWRSPWLGEDVQKTRRELESRHVTFRDDLAKPDWGLANLFEDWELDYDRGIEGWRIAQAGCCRRENRPIEQ